MIMFSTPQAVADIRQRIGELQLELDAQRRAPLSDDEAAEKATAMIAAHAAGAQTDRILSHLIHASTSARIGWPVDQDGSSIEPSAFDLFCALEPKRMHELLKKLIKGSDHLRGPAQGERAERIEALTAELREAEIEEEALITQAEVSGLNVHRRPDADPAIILGEL
ncbi:hypothetical protein [Luteimonas aestuarii]|uniref:hypothetical protein n=1 Tax=Luteimonas aestuarii TaxID=453837 RepID=UPI001405017C|nr:hypothetical protein [Luteimonas aestuarii]